MTLAGQVSVTKPRLPGGAKGGANGTVPGAAGADGAVAQPGATVEQPNLKEGVRQKVLNGAKTLGKTAYEMVNPTLSATDVANASHTNQAAKGNSTSHTGSKSTMGANSLNGSDTTTATTGASEQNGTNEGGNMSMSTFSSMTDIYKARWLAKQDAPAPVSMDQLAEAARNHTLPGQSAAVNQLYQKATGVPKDYAKQEGADEAALKKAQTEAKRREAAADQASSAAQSAANPAFAAAANGINKDQAIANPNGGGPAAAAKAQLPAAIHNAEVLTDFDKAKSAVGKAADAAGGEVKKAFKSLASTMSDVGMLEMGAMPGASGAATGGNATAGGNASAGNGAVATGNAASTKIAPATAPASGQPVASSSSNGAAPTSAPAAAGPAATTSVAAAAPGGVGTAAATSSASAAVPGATAVTSTAGNSASGGASTNASSSRDGGPGNGGSGASGNGGSSAEAAGGTPGNNAQTMGHGLAQTDMLKQQNPAETAAPANADGVPAAGAPAADNAAPANNAGVAAAGAPARDNVVVTPGKNMGSPTLDDGVTPMLPDIS
jgi:hypothetical protein